MLSEVARAETTWGVSYNGERKVEAGFGPWPLTLSYPGVLSLEAGGSLHCGNLVPLRWREREEKKGMRHTTKGTRDGERDFGGELGCHRVNVCKLHGKVRCVPGTPWDTWLLSYCEPHLPSVPFHRGSSVSTGERALIKSALLEGGNVYTCKNNDLGSTFWK